MLLGRNYINLILILILFHFASANSSLAQVTNINDYQYISPLHGSSMNLPECNIIIREGDLINRSSISSKNIIEVTGSKSGRHKGEIILSSDSRTLIFDSYEPYERGEEIKVSFNDGISTTNDKKLLPLEFSFDISNQLPEKSYANSVEEIVGTKSVQIERAPNNLTKSFTIPDDLPEDFPNVNVSISNNPSPGYIFLAPYEYPFYYFSYLLIVDNSGIPIFYRRYSSWKADFKLQPNGYLSYWDIQARKHFIMDSSYSIIDSYSCQNGYSTDFHEFFLLENGHSFLMSYDFQTVRMDTVVQGGDSSAVVIGLVIQELDSEKNVIFQWRSWDHFQITDATEDVDLTAHTIDYVHGNAIEIDQDGHLLLSSRHLDEITKINRQTGEIIWRWGGVKSRKNEFLFVNDPITFSHQHDIRRTEYGNLTIFDNGNLHTPSFSRSLEYEVDEIAKVATLIWKYNNEPKTYARAMGSAVKLTNSNTLIGWGLHYNIRTINEVKPDGTVALELLLPDTVFSYRAFKFPWKTNLFVTDIDSVFFDSVLVGDSAVTIVNLVSNSLNERRINITGFFNKDSTFIVEHEVPFVLPPNSLEPIKIKFKPVLKGNYKDTLHIRSDTDTSRIAQILVLTGIADTVLGNEIEYTFYLEQNYPNPFNLKTTTVYGLSEKANVEIKVFDILGREVKSLVNEEKTEGRYEIEFDASDLSSGIYFYQLRAGSFVATKKMVLLK
jgi:hypothetical protein